MAFHLPASPPKAEFLHCKCPAIGLTTFNYFFAFSARRFETWRHCIKRSGQMMRGCKPFAILAVIHWFLPKPLPILFSALPSRLFVLTTNPCLAVPLIFALRSAHSCGRIVGSLGREPQLLLVEPLAEPRVSRRTDLSAPFRSLPCGECRTADTIPYEYPVTH